MGCSQIRFILEQEDTLFYGTSDEGELFSGYWAPKKLDEASKGDIIQDYWDYARNLRPTVNLQISPFFKDILLTIHDCGFCIWKLDCEEPIFISPTIDSTYITCGFFSPQRPGVLFIGRADGRVDIWDFLDQSNAPTQQHLVVAIGINSMRINPSIPRQLAAGDRDGCLHLLHLPANLYLPSSQERQSIASFFAREKERVVYFKNRFESRIEESQKKAEQADDYDIDLRDGNAGRRNKNAAGNAGNGGVGI